MIQAYCLALFHWCAKKIIAAGKPPQDLFKEGEIWHCSMAMPAGRKVYGRAAPPERPMLVLQKLNSELLLGIPLVNTRRQGDRYVPVVYDGKESKAAIDHVRVLHKERLLRQMGALGGDGFMLVKKTVLAFYNP